MCQLITDIEDTPLSVHEENRMLGQFFTPPIIKKCYVNITKSILTQICDDTETFLDPAVGTGGFFITFIKYLEKEAKYKNIKLDWNFIFNQGLSDIEAEPDTFQLEKFNMLLSTGQLCYNIHLGDSIQNTIKEKYDIIFANPPF